MKSLRGYRSYHWHYRPAQSKSRTELIAAMKKWGFSLWKDEIVEPEDLQTLRMDHEDSQTDIAEREDNAEN